MFSVSGKDKPEVSGVICSLKRTVVKTSITPTKSRETVDRPKELEPVEIGNKVSYK